MLLANFLSPIDMLIVGIVAIMLFGNRLPEVARSLGRSLNEFKKGMQELENEVKTSIYSEPTNRMTYQDRIQPSAPRPEPAPPATAQTAAPSPPSETVNS
jgi:sec-independent protein translocase protein TatA